MQCDLKLLLKSLLYIFQTFVSTYADTLFPFFLGAKVLAQLIGGRLDLNEVITDQPKASILQAAWIANDGSFFKSPRRSRALPSDHHGAISSQLHPSCG